MEGLDKKYELIGPYGLGEHQKHACNAGFCLRIIPKMRFYAENPWILRVYVGGSPGRDRPDNEAIGENGCLKPKIREISRLGWEE